LLVAGEYTAIQWKKKIVNMMLCSELLCFRLEQYIHLTQARVASKLLFDTMSFGELAFSFFVVGCPVLYAAPCGEYATLLDEFPGSSQHAETESRADTYEYICLPFTPVIFFLMTAQGMMHGGVQTPMLVPALIPSNYLQHNMGMGFPAMPMQRPVNPPLPAPRFVTSMVPVAPVTVVLRMRLDMSCNRSMSI
jgi:hypothetical protein